MIGAVVVIVMAGSIGAGIAFNRMFGGKAKHRKKAEEAKSSQ